MGESNFFTDEVLAAGGHVDVAQASPRLAAWAAAVVAHVQPCVAAHGFVRTQLVAGADHARVRFACGDRWLQAEANADPREAPACYNLVMGATAEGVAMQVALWRLQRLEPAGAAAGEYALPAAAAAMGGSLAAAAQDLAQAAGGFLRSDITPLRAAWQAMLEEITRG